MIISHKHHFVFIQVARTGSSFIGNYLINHLAGEPILTKHVNYTEFLENASPLQKNYRVIIGKRHPLDKVTTLFQRKQNNRGITFKDINALQIEFARWFRENSYLEGSRRSLDHLENSYPYADYTIRQECLAIDLEKAINEMGLSVNKYPHWKKKTRNKIRDYTQYYSKSIIPLAVDSFKAEMDQLGYQFPENWLSS